MSREIKFRKWNDIQNFMSDVDTLDLEVWNDENEKPSNIHLMQFTGLKDRKGVDIYEGDIVRYQINPHSGATCFQNMEVVWNDRLAGYGIAPINNPNSVNAYLGGNFDDGRVNTRCEVVGNIYEVRSISNS